MKTLLVVVILVLVLGFVLTRVMQYFFESYGMVIKPVILEVLLEKDRLNLEELAKQTYVRAGREFPWTPAESRTKAAAMAYPIIVPFIAALIDEELLHEERAFETNDFKRIAKYRILSLTDKGRNHALQIQKQLKSE